MRLRIDSSTPMQKEELPRAPQMATQCTQLVEMLAVSIKEMREQAKQFNDVHEKGEEQVRIGEYHHARHVLKQTHTLYEERRGDPVWWRYREDDVGTSKAMWPGAERQ